MVQQLIWFWCVCERRWVQSPSTLPSCLQSSWLPYWNIQTWNIAKITKSPIGSSGVGVNWKASAGVQRRNYKAAKSGGDGAWWLSSVAHYFGWPLTDTIRLKSAVELILLSVWKHICCWWDNVWQVFQEDVLFVFNNTDHFCPKLASLKCLLTGEIPEVPSAVNAHESTKWGAFGVLRGMVFQMLGALLSSKIVSRGSYLWLPSIKIIGRRNLLAMTRMGLPDVSSLIQGMVLLWDPRTWEHRSHACVHVASSTLIETPTSGSWGRYMFNFMKAFNWSSKARAPICIVWFWFLHIFQNIWHFQSSKF